MTTVTFMVGQGLTGVREMNVSGNTVENSVLTDIVKRSNTGYVILPAYGDVVEVLRSLNMVQLHEPLLITEQAPFDQSQIKPDYLCCWVGK